MSKIVKIGLRLSKICRKYRRLFFPDTVHSEQSKNKRNKNEPCP